MATNLNISENQERVPLSVGNRGVLRTITPDNGSPYYVGARAYVTQTAGGAIVTVIDKDGTTTATISNGTDGTDGIGITDISLTSTVGNVDTYTITYDNGDTDTFTVTNGIDGYSPSASVSKVGDTATITITDENGTTTASISDGNIDIFIAEYYVTTYADVKNAWDAERNILCKMTDGNDTVILPLIGFDGDDNVFYFCTEFAKEERWAILSQTDGWDDYISSIAQVNADWNETQVDSPALILNKPTITPNVVYCTCSTAAATQQKDATIVSGSLTTLSAGDQVIVKFTNANSKADPTLKVGTTDAKSIKRYGTSAPSTSAASSWNAGSCVYFVYDGTYWQMIGWLNTTYSEISEANITNSTGSSTGLITGRRAKKAVETFAPVKDVTVGGTSVLNGTTAEIPTVSARNIWYGTSSTASGTGAKVVTTASGDFTLTTGNMLCVLFSTSNSSANVWLAVDGQTATSVQPIDGTSNMEYRWRANEAVMFLYNGSKFIMLEQGLADTSWYGITRLNSATNSTSTSEAATPSAVKSAYDLANGKSTVSVSQIASTGTAIADVSVNGTTTHLYAGEGTADVKTESGSIVSISDASAYPAIDLQADIVAVQPNDYDSVWVGGAGKNKLPPHTTQTLSSNDVTCKHNGDGSITLNGTASATAIFNLISETAEDNKLYLPAGSYILNGDSIASNDFWIGAYKNATSGSWSVSSKSSGGAFSMSAGDYIYPRIRIGAGVALSNVTIYPMIRLSTESATYEPYSNICPISGFTEVKVYVSPTTQQADATVYTIDLDGTRYGGTLDVTSGVLTVTHKHINLGDYTWEVSGNGNYYTMYNATIANEIKRPTSAATLVGCICSCYEEATTNAMYNADVNYTIGVRNTNGNLWVRDTTNGTSGANLKTFLTGKDFVYELATPLTVNLTAQEIELLQGANNVWADSGDTTLKYFTASDSFHELSERCTDITLQKEIADYIVEQGTSGDWTYRKWNSGVAECWTTSLSVGSKAMTTAEGYGYYASLSTYNYPTSFFISTPSVEVTGDVNGALGGFSVSSETSSGVQGYWWATRSITKTCAINIHAIGRWK